MLGNKKPKGTVALKKEMLHERERNWPFRDEGGLPTSQIFLASATAPLGKSYFHLEF